MNEIALRGESKHDVFAVGVLQVALQVGIKFPFPDAHKRTLNKRFTADFRPKEIGDGCEAGRHGVGSIQLLGVQVHDQIFGVIVALTEHLGHSVQESGVFNDSSGSGSGSLLLFPAGRLAFFVCYRCCFDFRLLLFLFLTLLLMLIIVSVRPCIHHH